MLELQRLPPGAAIACRDDAQAAALVRLPTDPVLGISDPAVLAQLQAQLAAVHGSVENWP